MTDASDNRPTLHAHLPEGLGLKEFVVLMSALIAMTALSIDTMLPALPDIGHSLAIANANDRQLIISVFFLGLAGGSLIYGPLSDHHGRKPVLLWAMALFLVSNLICTFTPSFPLMLAGAVHGGVFRRGVPGHRRQHCARLLSGRYDGADHVAHHVHLHDGADGRALPGRHHSAVRALALDLRNTGPARRRADVVDCDADARNARPGTSSAGTSAPARRDIPRHRHHPKFDRLYAGERCDDGRAGRLYRFGPADLLRCLRPAAPAADGVCADHDVDGGGEIC
jgi:hypothetical protein